MYNFIKYFLNVTIRAEQIQETLTYSIFFKLKIDYPSVSFLCSCYTAFYNCKQSEQNSLMECESPTSFRVIKLVSDKPKRLARHAS